MKKLLYSIILILILFIIVLVYGSTYGLKGLNTKEYVIKANNIDKSFNGLKILQFSDLHYGKYNQKEEIKKLLKEINLINADIVVFTGDLISNDIDNEDKEYLINFLSNINSKYGKYAILGDNDYNYKEDIINIYNESSFKLLDNTYEIIRNEENSAIFLGGVGSIQKNDANITNVIKYFSESDTLLYKILLIHESSYVDEVNDYNFDLVLSGHSIGGVIGIPFINNIFLDKYDSKYYNEYYNVNNTNLYVSNGIGTDKIKLRILNKPSINSFRFEVSA